MTLVEFLEARIRDDERSAVWGAENESDFWAAVTGMNLGALDLDVSMGALDHMGRWEPARVLAECAAKRALVDLHRHDREHQCPNLDGSSDYYNYAQGWAEEADNPQLCPTLRLLAQPYASHADFDASWVVSGD